MRSRERITTSAAEDTMRGYMEIHSADEATFTIPLEHLMSKDEYSAEQPLCAKQLNIIEVLFYSDTLEKPVRFALESFTLSEGEEGRWTLTINRRIAGPRKYDLEYCVTAQHGKPLREPLCFQYDHDKQDMVVS
jgi:hypothetical protein